MDGPIRVLHVDDEPGFADLAADFLERADDRLVVETATGPGEGLDRIAEGGVDCVVSDYDMPEMDGVAFLEAVRERTPDLPFVLFTGKGGEEVASEAISAGVTDYLQKGSGTDQYAILANRVVNAVEARRSERESDRRRHRLEQILKTVPACVVQLDTEGRFVYANRRAEEVLGLEREELTDRTYNDPDWRIADLDGEPIPDEELPFRRVRDTGEPVYDVRHRIVWPDGSRRTLQVSGAPLFDADGEVDSVVFSLSDVTERLERESELERSAARLAALFDESPDMINFHDGEGTILDANPRLCEVTGYEESELVGMKVWELDPTVGPAEARELWAGMEPGDTRRLEGRFRRRDGSTVPVEVHVRRLDVEDADRFVVISRVIAERRERERRLERYETIVESIDDAAFVVGPDGTLEFANRASLAVVDAELAEVVGEPIVGLVEEHAASAEASERFERALDRAFDAGDPEEFSERVELPLSVGGEEYAFEYQFSPVVEDGETRSVAITSRDVTERRREEGQLRRDNERLQEFAEVVSHDLRGPLNVAEGRVDLALAEGDGEHLEAAAAAIDRSQSLVEDLLALAREGEEATDPEPVDLAAVVEDCWGTAVTEGASVYVQTDRTLRADRGQLRQLLANLLANAVEHGGPGVTVTVGDLDDGFYVADDGPGIPEGQREDVLRSGYSTDADGAGLGLSIVQRIADGHGWTLSVGESEDGGARFEVTGVEFVD